MAMMLLAGAGAASATPVGVADYRDGIRDVDSEVAGNDGDRC